MTNPEVVNNVFEACTGLLVDHVKQLTSVGDYNSVKQKYDIQKFRNKLIPHQMELFTEPLFHYMIIELKRHNDRKKNDKRGNILFKQRLDEQVELVLILKELLSGGQLNLSIINIPKTHTIHNKEIIDLLKISAIEALTEEIQRLGLNELPLPPDIAEFEINSHADIEWVKNWMDSFGFKDVPYESFSLNEMDKYFDVLGMSNIFNARDKTRKNLISEYAYDHPEVVYPDKIGVERILKNINKVKPRKGRTQETEELKFLVFTLSILARVDRYIKDQKIKNITDVPIENADCRYIHDVLAFFGFIRDYTEHSKTAKSLEKRIRKMLADVDDPIGVEDMNERMTVFRS